MPTPLLRAPAFLFAAALALMGECRDSVIPDRLPGEGIVSFTYRGAVQGSVEAKGLPPGEHPWAFEGYTRAWVDPADGRFLITAYDGPEWGGAIDLALSPPVENGLMGICEPTPPESRPCFRGTVSLVWNPRLPPEQDALVFDLVDGIVKITEHGPTHVRGTFAGRGVRRGGSGEVIEIGAGVIDVPLDTGVQP